MIVKIKIELSEGESPAKYARICRDDESAGCPSPAGFECPFDKPCATVKASDWAKILKTGITING